jgi:hypothetical protein
VNRRNSLDRWDAATAGLLLALAVLMSATVLDYGVTADEGVQQRYGRRVVRWYLTLGGDRSATEKNNLFLYGGAFELAAQAVQRVSPLGVYDSRHIANAGFGLGGIVAAWGLGRLLGGPAAGFASALFLALTPVYYGHCFANPKDVPFAAFYAAAAWAILRAAGDRLRPFSGRVALAGVAVGLTAGVRVNGIVLVAFAGLLWGASGWAEGRGFLPSRRETFRMGLSLAVLLVVAWAVMLACWPWAQVEPLRHPLLALRTFSDFQGNPVLFEGEGVASTALPRHYVPKLFALTLPEFYAVAGALGIFGLFAGGLSHGARRRRAALRAGWVAALAALPVGWAILDRTPLYNGVRHLLFVVPILAVLAGAAVTAAVRSRLPAAVLVPGMTALVGCLAAVGVDMVRLHPYQYAYFNRLIGGGLASAVGRYETDYWSTSYKEGVEWVCAHYSTSELREPLRIGGNMYVPFSSYLGRGRCIAPCFTAVPPEQDPHVLLVAPAERDEVSPVARLLHTVERVGAPLLYVYELKPPR